MGKECRHPLTQSVLEFFGGRKMTIGQLEEESLDLGFSIKRMNQKPGGELGKRQRLLNTIKPSQMEVAPLHRTFVISHKRRLFKNTKGI